MSLEPLPDGWEIWNREREGRVILAFRPDVFDSRAFPAACLPTIYVTNRSQRRRPESSHVVTDTWTVRLFLEPDVDAAVEHHEDREAALAAARSLAEGFAAGKVDYRGAYQSPREEYLAKLDDLIGRDD